MTWYFIKFSIKNSKVAPPNFGLAHSYWFLFITGNLKEEHQKSEACVHSIVISASTKILVFSFICDGNFFRTGLVNGNSVMKECML
jgi:hypothetical protein